MDILIVTSRPEQWAPVLPVMEGRGAAVRQAGSLEQGMELVRRQAPALAVLDLGLERMPTSQVRFTDTNTYPFLEAYYAASAMGDKEAAAKGDALLREYAQTLIEYIEHYLRFEGAQGDMVSGLIDEKLDQLGDIYYLASYADRKEVVAELNDYYRSLGVSEENLIDVGDKRQQPDSALLPAAK